MSRSQPEAQPKPARPPRRAWRSDWRSIATGMGIGASLTMVGMLLFWHSETDALRSELLPWAAPSRWRGGNLPAFSQVRLAATAKEVALSVGVPTNLDSALPAQLKLLAPNGRTLLDRSVSAAELQRGSLLLLLREASPLAPGIYVIRFQQDDLPEDQESNFEIVRLD